MDAKTILLIASIISYASCAGLLRTPKVYNAVITTDENITPSRAYPVIQPTIHETGIATYPFSPYNPYRFYNHPPVVQFTPSGEAVYRSYQPNHLPKDAQFPFQVPPHLQPQSPFGFMPRFGEEPYEPAPPKHGKPEEKPDEKEDPNAPEENDIPPKKQQKPTKPPKEQKAPAPGDEKLPIPLNEFGLPPSLVPLHSFPRPTNPINLQPYPYNHYPLIYDSYNQFPSDQYLPPFGYYPPPGFGPHFAPNIPQQQPAPAEPNEPADPEPAPEEPPKESEDEPETSEPPAADFENIKNGSKNKNSEVPDVPPPPIPSGAKKDE